MVPVLLSTHFPLPLQGLWLNALVVGVPLVGSAITFGPNLKYDKDAGRKASRRLTLVGLSFLLAAFGLLSIVFTLISFPYLDLPIQLALIFGYYVASALLKLVWRRNCPRRYLAVLVFAAEYFAEVNLAFVLPFLAAPTSLPVIFLITMKSIFNFGYLFTLSERYTTSCRNRISSSRHQINPLQEEFTSYIQRQASKNDSNFEVSTAAVLLAQLTAHVHFIPTLWTLWSNPNSSLYLWQLGHIGEW